MTIAKPGSWLAGYILGISTIRIYRKRGWAVGKGNLKKQISKFIRHNIHICESDSTKGYIDAILDSVN